MTGNDGRPFDDDAQRWLLDQLAAVPDPPLPGDVRARWDDTISEESHRRAAAPPVAERAGRSGRWLWAGAAAAAVVVVAGVVTVPRMGVQDAATPATTTAIEEPAPAASDGCAVSATPDADLQPVMSATGTTYTAAALAGQAETLRGQAQQCTAVQGSSETGQTDAADTVSACVVSVAAGHPVLAVDTGWYDDHEAVVAVIRLPPTRAYVLDCSTRPTKVLYDVELPQE